MIRRVLCGAAVLLAPVAAEAQVPDAPAPESASDTASPPTEPAEAGAAPTSDTPDAAVETDPGSNTTDTEGTVSVLSDVPEADWPAPRPRSLKTRMERMHGMMEIGLGWLTLPGAEVCVSRGENPDCRRGDSSLSLEAWQIFRMPNGLALGGGVLLGLTPTTDTPARQLPDVERDHSRGYMTVETTVRYYPYVGDSVEGWLGLHGGLVVISDTFSTASDEETPLVGSSGVVVRTEGASFGFGGGIAYEFARNWTVGGNLRLGSWFLPNSPDVSPLGDEASLVGQNSMFIVALNIAYRVQL